MSAQKAASSWAHTIPEGGLTGSSTTQLMNLGDLVKDTEGNIYRYVQIHTADAQAVTDGEVLYLRSTSSFIVSPDMSAMLGVRPVGVAIGAIAAGSYGFMLVSGFHDAVWTDGAVSEGDALVGHSTDGEADTFADGEEEQAFAMALAADTTTDQHTVAALVYCL